MGIDISDDKEKQEEKHRKRVEMWALIDVIIAVGLIMEPALLKSMGYHLEWQVTLIFAAVEFLLMFSVGLAAFRYGG